jgi:hypothetical protein
MISKSEKSMVKKSVNDSKMSRNLSNEKKKYIHLSGNGYSFII